MSASSNRIYRLDTFTVPDAALGEFVSRIRETHELLREQPGFIQDFIWSSLQRTARSGS